MSESARRSAGSAPAGLPVADSSRDSRGMGVAHRVTVTVRISVIESSPIRRIAVDGRLSRDEVGELEQAIGSEVAKVRLELANLRGADADGLAALARLRLAGVELRGLSPHLAWQIGASPR